MGKYSTENKCEWPCCKSKARPGKKMCFMHGRVYEISTSKPAPTPIAKKSEKFKVEHKEYAKIVKDMLKENDKCEMGSPVCTGKAQGLHHAKKRGSNLLNKEFLLRSCNACNTWVEANTHEAKEMGLILSKF